MAQRSIIRVLVAAALLCISAGCGNRESRGPGGAGGEGTSGAERGARRLVLLNNGNSPFWDACRLGLQEAARDFKLNAANLAVVMEVNDGTVQGQIDRLRQFSNMRDIAGVAISALDADNAAVAEEMRKLRARGVQVICVDADVDRSRFRDARSYYIGTDNLSAGRELGVAARRLLEARGSRGSYVQFVGRTGSHNAIERMGGFKEAAGAAYIEADRMADDTDRTRARENVRNAIRNHPDLVALVGIWSYNAPAIVDVVRQEQRREKFVIATFDAEPIAVTQMGQGDIDVMVVQNPYEMGYQGVRLLRALINGDRGEVRAMFPKEAEPGGDLYDTGLKLVVPDGASLLKREMFGARTQFMTLTEFKRWLQERGLTGS
jgi:ribose transport system substrate-binding protein